jgi:hypothetical protein
MLHVQCNLCRKVGRTAAAKVNRITMAWRRKQSIGKTRKEKTRKKSTAIEE